MSTLDQLRLSAIICDEKRRQASHSTLGRLRAGTQAL